MITKLTVRFKANDKLKYSCDLGSVMQSVMMENISPDCAAKLHVSEIHPYSQHTEYKNGAVEWTVSALNGQAKEHIIMPLLSDTFCKVHLVDKDIDLDAADKKLVSFSYDELFQRAYVSETACRYIGLEFITPVSFKQDGGYVNFPFGEMIIKNLMRKYDSASGSTKIYDEALKEHTEKNTRIVEYSLHTVKYKLSGVNIPAAIGRVTLKISGAPEFVRLINMLLEYGEYSGTGIKTSMGMGAYRITGKRGKING
ncbi:MAG: CRISPR system precrRNA processing endoribonuclease RAMP protein Cas6 [Ruminococcus sp.]|nr:CRISPR system precrRNA processing endoribonuclease RAMP protein Cas6 [Ruminococcus sp.]